MRRFIKHSVIVIVVSLILVNILSYTSLWSLRESSFYKPSFLMNTVEEEDFDYIILGASTGLTTLNTKAIDSVLGTSGINLAMDDTGIASHYLMLQHFLNQGKTSKYCLLVPNAISYDINYSNVSDNDYRFLPFVNEDYVNTYYDAYDGFESNVMSVSDYVPFVGVSYYNAELFFPSLLTAVNAQKRNRFDERGNYTYPERNVKSVPISSKIDKMIKFKNTDLEAIWNLCKANDIELICYVAPMQDTSIKTKVQNFQVINHSDLLDNTKYFYDTIHVNEKGRQLTSLEFAADIKAIFDSNN